MPRVRDYLQLLRRGWAVILIATALSAGAGWLAWQTSAPVYDSTARVFVTTAGGATPLDAYYGHLTSLSRTTTIQQLARSPQVTMRTIEQLDLDDRPSQLASRITLRVKNSAMVDIIVTGRDPDETRATANSVAENLVGLSRQMSGVDTGSAELVLVDAADPSGQAGFDVAGHHPRRHAGPSHQRRDGALLRVGRGQAVRQGAGPPRRIRGRRWKGIDDPRSHSALRWHALP